jgi:hypothetical protein
MWNKAHREGVKYDIAKFMESLDESFQQEMESMDLEKAAETASNIRCVPAAFGDDMFRPPSGVNFRDMTEMMTKSVEMSAKMDEKGGLDAEDLCSMCDMIPDPKYRAECLENC